MKGDLRLWIWIAGRVTKTVDPGGLIAPIDFVVVLAAVSQQQSMTGWWRFS